MQSKMSTSPRLGYSQIQQIFLPRKSEVCLIWISYTVISFVYKQHIHQKSPNTSCNHLSLSKKTRTSLLTQVLTKFCTRHLGIQNSSFLFPSHNQTHISPLLPRNKILTISPTKTHCFHPKIIYFYLLF